MQNWSRKFLVIAGTVLFLAGCASGPIEVLPQPTPAPVAPEPPPADPDLEHLDTSVSEFKVGPPYKVRGKVFTPKVDWDYRAEGMASWYNPRFHGKRTASGEKYDRKKMTAAHPTLPLPSFVRVTNPQNGKSVVLRVNDRGPFTRNRIIDVSEAAAEKLGFKLAGEAKVQVEILAEQSRAAALKAGYTD